MAALAAIERALRKGDLETRPTVDAERIARVAQRHGLTAEELAEAAADIRDWSRKPRHPVAVVVWRVLGDPGADVLDRAIRLLCGNTSGSTAAV
jgi:hypothetical protein